MNLEESKKGVWIGLEGGKGRGNDVIVLKSF